MRVIEPFAAQDRDDLAGRELREDAESLDRLADRPGDLGQLRRRPAESDRPMKARRISLVPSKIMLIRLSRRSCSYGYSLMYPMPAAIWSVSLTTFHRVSLPYTLQMADSSE